MNQDSKIDSRDSDRWSKLIEDLLTDWVAARSAGFPSLFEGLLESRRSYLEKVFPDLVQRAQNLGMTKSTDAIALGGDALHLSSTYREEQVTDWLAALLAFQPFPPAERPDLLARVISDITASPEYRRYSGHDEESTIVFHPDYKLTREVRVVLKTSRLGKFDLVVESGSRKIMVFEIKVGDTDFAKNIGYRDFLIDEDEWRDAIRVMILPGRDLDIIERDGSVGANDGGDTLRAEDVLKAFLPVRWETLLIALRRESPEPGSFEAWRSWISIAAAFAGFVEHRVLGLDLDRVRDALGDGGFTGQRSFAIAELERYVTYREENQ